MKVARGSRWGKLHNWFHRGYQVILFLRQFGESVVAVRSTDVYELGTGRICQEKLPRVSERLTSWKFSAEYRLFLVLVGPFILLKFHTLSVENLYLIIDVRQQQGVDVRKRVGVVKCTNQRI